MKNKYKIMMFILFTVIFLFGITQTVISPLTPVFSKQLEIGFDKIGIALLIGAIFSLIVTLLSVWISDFYDVRKI